MPDPPFAPNERRLEFAAAHGLEARETFEARLDPRKPAELRVWSGGEPAKGAAFLAGFGLLYLLSAATFWWLTWPQRPPGEWVWFATPSWSTAATLSGAYPPGSAFPWLTGVALLLLLFLASGLLSDGLLRSRLIWGSLVALGSAALLLMWWHRSTYFVEAGPEGVRERSALSWKSVPWNHVRTLVEEKRFHYGRPFSSRTTVLSRIEHAWLLETADGRTLVEIREDLPVESRNALLAHVQHHTGLPLEKRERKIGDSPYQ
ncbi:MAG: hypothetical protein K2Q23_02520 [Bryobacteraceae bacterium]|nr:hypothetical protein [Bryobacteraceae bacterium]